MSTPNHKRFWLSTQQVGIKPTPPPQYCESYDPIDRGIGHRREVEMVAFGGPSDDHIHTHSDYPTRPRGAGTCDDQIVAGDVADQLRLWAHADPGCVV